jgi:hypothetical protein
MPRSLRSLIHIVCTWLPWVVALGFAGSWGVGGASVGLPFLAGLAIMWSLVLIVIRDAVAARTTRLARLGPDVVLVIAAFVLAWEGGWSILPGAVAFVAADLVDPTTPRYPIGGSLRGRGFAVLAAGAVLLGVSLVLGGPLFSSASSVTAPSPT